MLLSVVAAAAQGGYGIYRGVKAQQGLNALSKQRKARFMDAAAPLQENKELYKKQYQGGMGPGSLNLAQNQFGMGQRQLLATPASGQLRDQIGRVASANQGSFALNLAAQNESIRRQGLGGMVGSNEQLSSLQQRDISNDIRQREDMERAYGKAVQDGFGDALGAAGGFAMMQQETNQANLNRELYQQMYGNQNSNLDMNMGSQSGQSLTNYTPSSLNSQFNALPSTMGGMGRFRTPADFNSPAYLNRLPYEMGGTSGFSQNYGLPPMPNFGKPTTKNYFQ